MNICLRKSETIYPGFCFTTHQGNRALFIAVRKIFCRGKLALGESLAYTCRPQEKLSDWHLMNWKTLIFSPFSVFFPHFCINLSFATITCHFLRKVPGSLAPRIQTFLRPVSLAPFLIRYTPDEPQLEKEWRCRNHCYVHFQVPRGPNKIKNTTTCLQR